MCALLRFGLANGTNCSVSDPRGARRSFGRRVAHGAGDVTLTVFEADHSTDADDLILLEHDRPAVGDDRCSDRAHVVHRDRALVADARAVAGRREGLMALAHGAVDSRVFRRAGVDQVEVWGPPGLETPAEHALVEAPSPLDVVRLDI